MARFVRLSAVCLLALLVFPALVRAQEERHPGLAFGMEFKFLTIMAGPSITAENIPQNLRQVPSHPNDTWIYGSRQVIRTIPSDSLNPGTLSNYSMAFLPEVTMWRFRVRGGPNISYNHSFGGAEKKNEGATREINQFGKPERGYGTSLVYYSMSGGYSWKPGITAEADLRLGDDYFILAGYGWNNFKLKTQNGYDRWDSLEMYREYDLGNYKFEKLYAGFGWQPDGKIGQPIKVFVTGGRGRIFGGNQIAKGMNLSGKWFVEFGFSAHAVFMKNK